MATADSPSRRLRVGVDSGLCPLPVIARSVARNAVWCTPAGLIVESGRLVWNGEHHGCREPFGPALRPGVEALPLQLGQVRQA